MLMERKEYIEPRVRVTSLCLEQSVLSGKGKIVDDYIFEPERPWDETN